MKTETICAATDWLALWAELVSKQEAYRAAKRDEKGEADVWRHKARKFDEMVGKRWSRPDTSREQLLEALGRNPGSTLLDIGAGTGAWTLLLAPHAARVTALEPSDAMAGILSEKLVLEGIENVDIVRGRWPDAEVPPHDFTLASHSLYGCADLRRCIERMIAVTRKRCFLLLRAASPDAVMARAAMRVLGHPHDSPNFQIAYNALLDMGICADVQVEPGFWDPWMHDSLEEALREVKARLGLAANSTHDRFLIELLGESLVWENGKYRWPPGARSALVHWAVG